MSELDLKLEWREEGERELRDDSFEGELSLEEGEVHEVELIETPRPMRPEDFEYSVDRARALDRALGRQQVVTRPPFVSYLRKLVDLPVRERTAALDGAEAWLASQLAYWKTGPVEGPESERFASGVSAGADALGLGLEVVTLLRGGDTTLVEPLLEQIEGFLTQAREALAELPAPEPDPIESEEACEEP